MRDLQVRRWAAAAAVVPLGLALAACGGGSTDAHPAMPSQTQPLWNPCDALSPAMIQQELGPRTKEMDGTPTTPDCRFVPLHKNAGDPVVSANYQLTAGNLDQYWKAMGQEKSADVTKPKIALADDARVVTSEHGHQLAVTGFVQNGDLYQVINIVDPAPYDKARTEKGIAALLTALSKHADETGAGASASASAK